MASKVKFLCTVALLLTTTIVLAQKPKPKAATPAKPVGFQKFTPPKLTTRLGIRSDSSVVTREEAVQLVKLPLIITDDKKGIYTISSYLVRYRRKGVVEDEQTGKVVPTLSSSIETFRSTPLSPLWIQILSEQIRPGEDLYFFDIVVKDAQGRLMFAPDLRIKVK